MVGVLRFLIFFVVTVGVLALVAVPALASPVLTQIVREAGLRGDDIEVSVGFFDPSLFSGRAEQLRIEGRNVQLGPATARGMDLTFGGVDLFERTFARVGGNLRDVQMITRGVNLTVGRVEISGPASAATVTGHFTPEQSASVVRQAARRASVVLDDVRLVDGGLHVTVGGVDTRAAIVVEGGALVLRPRVGPTVLLLRPAPTDPWRLSDAWISPDGVTIQGVVDVAMLAQRAIEGRQGH